MQLEAGSVGRGIEALLRGRKLVLVMVLEVILQLILELLRMGMGQRVRMRMIVTHGGGGEIES